jgi:Domain of unknown function (DUF4832)
VWQLGNSISTRSHNAPTFSTQLTAGSPFTVTSRWTNVNTAPAYIPWHVVIQLRNTAGNIVWQGNSQLDLTKPFSTASQGNDTKTITDTFTLPGTVANGSNKVYVQILDPAHYYFPSAYPHSMTLAQVAALPTIPESFIELDYVPTRIASVAWLVSKIGGVEK